MNYVGGLKWSFALLLGASLVACGGGSQDPILGSDGSGGNNSVVNLPANDAVLRSLSSFGIFAGTAGMTNSGNQTRIQMSGGAAANIGTTATVTSSITGFKDSTGSEYTVVPNVNEGDVTGTIYSCTNSTNRLRNQAHCDVADQALLDATAAYNDLAGRPDAGVQPGANLTGLTIVPGVYTAPGGSYLIEGGNLTLDGGANDVWVFKMADSLTVGEAAIPGNVLLTGGALAKNVYWQVGSAATINPSGGGTMVGTIIAQAGVAVSTAGNVAVVTIDGRLTSLNASVTVVDTVINVPAP